MYWMKTEGINRDDNVRTRSPLSQILNRIIFFQNLQGGEVVEQQRLRVLVRFDHFDASKLHLLVQLSVVAVRPLSGGV